MGIIGGSGSSYQNKGNNMNSTNSRRRSYGMMLILAFGASLLGVLILHKLRERRIYNLILKQKDQDFFSLQLLFQKERDYSQEMKRKNEETNAKIFALRDQKLELEGKLLEMQSTVDSLKDELKTAVIAFEEKQKEIEMLKVERDRMVRENENNRQVVALIESLKRKEIDIEELLKRQLEYPKKIWPASSSDDSPRSNPAANKTVGNGDTREAEKLRNAQGLSTVNDNAIAETKSSFVTENSISNSTDANSYNNSTKDDHREKLNNGAEGVNENQEYSDNDVQLTAKGDSGLVSNNSKGKRWRLIAKKRRFDKEGRGGFKSRVKRMSFKREMPQDGDNNHQFGEITAEIFSDAKSLETPKSKNSVNNTQ